MPHVNIHDGATHTLDNPTLPLLVQTFEMVFQQYHRHPESKSFAPDGTPCRHGPRDPPIRNRVGLGLVQLISIQLI